MDVLRLVLAIIINIAFCHGQRTAFFHHPQENNGQNLLGQSVIVDHLQTELLHSKTEIHSQIIGHRTFSSCPLICQSQTQLGYFVWACKWKSAKPKCSALTQEIVRKAETTDPRWPHLIDASVEPSFGFALSGTILTLSVIKKNIDAVC